MARRVSFCSRTAAELPGCGRRHSSRYWSGVISRPSEEVSSSWKSRSSHVNRGKNSESSASVAEAAEEAEEAAWTRIRCVSCATSESWSIAAALIAFSEL